MEHSIIEINSIKYGKKEVWIDSEDFSFINQWKWHVRFDPKNKCFYACRNDRSGGKHTSLSMSRVIMNETNPKIHIDHKDHNTLNNCKWNLRKATNSQNASNRNPVYKGKSEYIGVTYREVVIKGKTYKYWRARIGVLNKSKSLGLFKNESDAAIAYNEAAIKYHGEFAYLNKVG